jgi:hypothetical protein
MNIVTCLIIIKWNWYRRSVKSVNALLSAVEPKRSLYEGFLDN